MAAIFALPAAAQQYPSKPVRVIVPFAPGAETLPGYTLVTWYGVMTPRGTPAPVIQMLNAEVNKILQASDMKKMFELLGMVPTGGTAAKFDERIRTDYARWVKVVKESGLQIQ